LNPYLLSVLLGIIEGVTEFLPVSSTAHLRIAEAFLGVNLADGYWKMYSIVIQLGAILCLPIYFGDRISEFMRTFPRGERHNRTFLTHPLSLTMVAFVCTAAPAFLLTKVIGKHLESLLVMAWSLIIGGIIMWVIDAMYERGRLAMRPIDRMDEMSFGQAVWIGLCQTLSAVFPGTSRSMATISAGQLAGMSRSAALEFSFFLSMPTMVAATCYDLYKSLKHGGASALGAGPVGHQGWALLAIGFIVSFFVALVVVAWFMHWVRTRGFTIFAIYRIILGVAVLFWVLKL
jgi:undecaprenyl-diphosphatase